MNAYMFYGELYGEAILMNTHVFMKNCEMCLNYVCFSENCIELPNMHNDPYQFS